MFDTMNEKSLSLNKELLDKYFILNPNYIMRSDINRIILASTRFTDFDNIAQDNLATFIHPIHAMMLSFFKGDKTLNENLLEISSFFNITFETAYDLVVHFINNEKRVVVEYDNTFFYYPNKILIEYQTSFSIRTYTVLDFNLKGSFDFNTTRYNIPIDVAILLNTRCVTDCVYCYADKKIIHDCKIPFSRLVELIREAKRLGVRSFDLQGGELFLYEYWYELLRELFNAKYSLYISTKYPLSLEQILQLKELGVKEIQISLDSIFSDDLKKNLRVSENYCHKILNTIKLLNDNNFRIKLKSVITSLIFSIEKMEQYIDFFKQYENIYIIEFTAPAHSMYKSQEEFLSFRLTSGNIEEIKELLLRKQDECHFKLFADVNVTDKSFSLPAEVKSEFFPKRNMCTGNQSALLILPNGDVTLCEKSYFNKNLTIGNILENSIMDVWDSERAKNLFFIPQSSFPEDSACSRCSEFEDCRYNLGVCWVDAMASYGEENWLYPSPNCPFAPQPKYITYCE